MQQHNPGERFSSEPELELTQKSINAPSAVAAEVTSLTAYVNETYLYGYVNDYNIPVTLTLKTGSVVKSQVTTVSDGSYFNAYFSDVIAGGDTVQIDLPGEPTETVTVPPLSVNSVRIRSFFQEGSVSHALGEASRRLA
jgi:hypothetical protein